MNGLLPIVIPDAATPPAAPIVNDGFFPDIDPTSFRAQLRVRDAVTPERLRDALIAAIVTVGNDLIVWSLAQRLLGHATLGAVPAATIDGASRLVHLYRRAVFCNARAELVERYRDVDTTAKGQAKAEDLDPSIAELRRDALHAVRDLLGVGRTNVELI